MFSFDNRVTWKVFNGTSWVNANPATDQGMDVNTVQSITQDQWNLVFVAGTLDIVCQTETSDISFIPQLISFDFNYQSTTSIETAVYEASTTLKAILTSDTQLTVINTGATNETVNNLIVNILTF